MFGCSVNSVYIRIIRLRVHLQYDKVLVRERARHSPTSRIFSIHSEFIFCVSFRVRDAPPPDPRRLLRRLPFRESLPSAPQLRADATLRRRAGKAARRSRTDPSCCSAEPFLMKKERGKGGGAGGGGGGGHLVSPFLPAALSFVVLNAWVPRGTAWACASIDLYCYCRRNDVSNFFLLCQHSNSRHSFSLPYRIFSAIKNVLRMAAVC